MAVYVGKDVGITIQVPYEEDVSSQANGTNTVFTVANKPISDRDLDGIADETNHVTAYVNGSPVTVSAVDDSEGEVTLASAPAQGARVIIEYRYDLAPYVAQEITLEPRQVIEGIDGLGSDTIQIWAPLLKEISGSIKEVFKTKEQLDRLGKRKLASLYTQQFFDSNALDDFQGDVANFVVDNQELLVNSANSSTLTLKDTVLAYPKNGVIRCDIKHVSGDAGWLFRLSGWSYLDYYEVWFDASKQLNIKRVKAGSQTTLLQSSPLNLPSDFFPVEIVFNNAEISVKVSDIGVFSVIDRDPVLTEGMLGFHAAYSQNSRFDNFQVWKQTVLGEYGMIVSWNQAGQAVKIGLDGVIFPEGSIPAPKNEPVYIVTPFKAQTVKVIT